MAAPSYSFPTCPVTLTEGFAAPVVAAVQNALAYLGYYAGPISGVFDIGTQRAIHQFGIAAAIPGANGVINQALYRALDSQLSGLGGSFRCGEYPAII